MEFSTAKFSTTHLDRLIIIWQLCNCQNAKEIKNLYISIYTYMCMYVKKKKRKMSTIIISKTTTTNKLGANKNCRCRETDMNIGTATHNQPTAEQTDRQKVKKKL
ncbi:unnamed protein product [Ceratitis capitata]|uniref:(Mediterranean fruit fly) hypothetical protein n=1 Tax=Ceratitis capitata TaxID=7213 RepID=A0A811V964_CERCA|nr:unnamed protein product [Ceratitis capitata]